MSTQNTYGHNIVNALKTLPKASDHFKGLKSPQGDIGEFIKLGGDPTTDNLVKQTWQGLERIVWRGDTRAPNVMFAGGFTTWDSAPPNLNRYNLPTTYTHSPGGTPVKQADLVPMWRTGKEDIDCDTGVCVAVDPRGSVFFPLENPTQDIYLYACIVKDGIDTFAIQQALGKQAWAYNERVTAVIPGDRIIAAYPVKRTLAWQVLQSSTPDIPHTSSVGLRFTMSTAGVQWNAAARDAKVTRQNNKGRSDFEMMEKMTTFDAKLQGWKQEIGRQAAAYTNMYPSNDSFIDFNGKIKSTSVLQGEYTKKTVNASAELGPSATGKYTAKFRSNDDKESTMPLVATTKMKATVEANNYARSHGLTFVEFV